ncbi:MAG: type II/IV secretion system ATPase subunit [Candidatus Micrarchaeota archaeon]|nr:type II/IV secretion system ATPase subunit [Candidatus Micrarchaeota archaeon]
MMKTKIDDLISILELQKRITLEKASIEFKWNYKSLEKVLRALDKVGVVKLNYPLNLFQKPSVEILRHPVFKEEVEVTGKLVEQYIVKGLSGHISAHVSIILSETEKRPFYDIYIPEVTPETRSYFEFIKNEVSRMMPVGSSEKAKEEAENEFKTRHGLIAQVLEKDLSPDKNMVDALCGILLREMYGLGEIDVLMADNWLEEIVINSSNNPILVYHRKYGWLKTNIKLKNEEEIENYSSQVARKIGKQISLLNPILDAHLASGDRVNATIFPISTNGNTLTLRLFAKNPWTIVSFLDSKQNAMSLDMAALLWQAIHYEMNILVGGGTASGKTSALNSIISLIPPYQRIVTIEDTRELLLPSYQWNWVPLVTRAPNPEGLGEVSMLDLVVNSLRMRPDRIVMGEIRRKKEAEVLFEAMHTGHSVYATLHADTGAQIIKRLIEPPIELPPSEVEDVHLVLVQYRDRRKNLRRTLEISEVVSGPSGPELNKLYLWRPRTDDFQIVKPPRRYMEHLNLHTGMTEKDILADQVEKKMVLKWMLDNKLNQVEDVGKVMNHYYSDTDVLLKSIEKKMTPDKVFV